MHVHVWVLEACLQLPEVSSAPVGMCTQALVQRCSMLSQVAVLRSRGRGEAARLAALATAGGPSETTEQQRLLERVSQVILCRWLAARPANKAWAVFCALLHRCFTRQQCSCSGCNKKGKGEPATCCWREKANEAFVPWLVYHH